MEQFVILNAALAWFIAQSVKTVIGLVKRKRLGLVAALTGSGGMPSSHTAFVTGLAAAIYQSNGISLVFILALALAIITIRDALGVRNTVDQHAHVLNQLLVAQGASLAAGQPPLATNTGHQLGDVIGGLAVGLLTVLLVSFATVWH